MNVNVESFEEILVMIQSKPIMMRLKWAMKMIMLTALLRTVDADYQTLWLVV